MMPPRNLKKWYVQALMVLSVVIIGVCITYGMARQSDPKRILAVCAGESNKPLCYSSHIESTLRSNGIPEAFDMLAIAYDSDPAFAGTCHAVTHELGKQAYEDFSKTGKTELTSKAWYCGYGFYHGFMDALVLETNSMEQAREFCSYVGQNVPHPPAPEFAEGSCYHGIGHGVTDGTDPRLWGDPIEILKPGLALCEQVAAGNTEWHMRCASGVFNALGNMYFDAKYKLRHPKDPYTLCRTGPFTDLEREQCYSQMNTEAAYLAHNDLQRIVGFSNSITDPKFRAVALHEAVSFYIQTLKYDSKVIQPEEMKVCELPTATLRETCVHGIVSGMIEFGSPGQQYKDIFRVCKSDSFPSNLVRSCYGALQELAPYYYTPDVSALICSEIPKEDKTALCSS